MQGLRFLLSVSVLSTLAGCGDDSTSMFCPEKEQEFFESSVYQYFNQHPPTGGIESVRVLPGATYDTHTNWWGVPVDVANAKYTALLSCDGRLELSYRE